MGFLEYLKNSAKSPITTYTKFLQQYKPTENSLHIFLEGKDDPSFYSNYLERNKKRGQKIYFYNSKNKSGVYENYSRVNWSFYKKNRVLFFVDKDFSDIIRETYDVDSNIFVTKYYSIENYLVSKTLFARCLRELFGLVDDKLINSISKDFSIALEQFHIVSLNLMSILVYYRKNKIPINLNNIDFNKVYEVKVGEKVLKKKYIREYLSNCTSTDKFPTLSEIKEIKKELKKYGNPKYYTRGKCELWFMIKYLNELPKLLNTGIKKGEPKVKLCVNLTSNNAVQIIAPRLRIPIDIKDFLIKNLKNKSA